tara:strand:- start:10601 stop:11899 length:1299 start_codon:yes stop_codon:yes gene_type:complete
LLRNRTPEAAIWELIVLYVAHKALGDVEHEPGEGMPDVFISDYSFSLEAHVVFSQSEATRRLMGEFDLWIHKRIAKAGISIESSHTVTELIDKNMDVQLPDKNKWREQMRRNSWKEFLDSLRESGKGVWEIRDYNMRIFLKLTKSYGSTGASFVPKVSERVLDNPLYKALRRKSKQIRKWEGRVRATPVVLVVGAFEDGAEFDNGSFGGRGIRDQVVWSSLVDPSDIDPLQAYNIMGADLRISDEGLEPSGRSYRVPGSDNISAVVFVQFRTTLDRYRYNKEADARIYVNPRALNPLNDEQIWALQSMDFSIIEYGPGWESWEGGARSSMRERNLKRGGGWQFQSLEGGGFTLEIPAISLTQVLSGLKSSEQVLGGKSDNPNPQDFLVRALEENCELLAVQIVEPESQREERLVKLEFGPPAQAMISRAKEK